ncbi:TPA: hypothetical protein ENG04_07825 [Candidatus Poribacteria bacterium]|nr:hypothetical protein [Candidatus Poribacteria bacterium]HEX29973.1 hypothetical protein [Candidatus Poribacteria bacterium]
MPNGNACGKPLSGKGDSGGRTGSAFGADGKEAIAFAVLAHRTVMGLAGNLPSATGASMPVILGSLTLP